MQFKIIRKPRQLKLGEDYFIGYGNNKLFPCKFIKPTKCGFNFLNIKTNKCILKQHLYPSKCDNHKSGDWFWLDERFIVSKINNMTKEEKDRKEFLIIYSEFDKYLLSLGFRKSTYNETSTFNDYHYSYYDNYVSSLYGVECFKHDILQFSIRFLRDRYEHKFLLLFVEEKELTTTTIQESKEIILTIVRQLRDEKLLALNKLTNI